MIPALLAHLAGWWQSRVTPEPDEPVYYAIQCWCGWVMPPEPWGPALEAWKRHEHNDGSATLPGLCAKSEPPQKEQAR
jgi:hypothetical protein